jgi:hypothetical protein
VYIATLVKGSLTISNFVFTQLHYEACPESNFASIGLFVIVWSIDLSPSVPSYGSLLSLISSILSSFSICSFSVELESAHGAQSAALFAESSLATIRFPLCTNYMTGEY